MTALGILSSCHSFPVIQLFDCNWDYVSPIHSWHLYIYIYIYIQDIKLQIFTYLKNIISVTCTLLGPLPDSVQSSLCNKKVTVITFNSVLCCLVKHHSPTEVDMSDGVAFQTCPWQCSLNSLLHCSTFCHYFYLSAPYLAYPLFGTGKLVTTVKCCTVDMFWASITLVVVQVFSKFYSYRRIFTVNPSPVGVGIKILVHGSWKMHYLNRKR